MNCGLVSDITFAGGQPAIVAKMQVRAAIGFTLLAFCKGTLGLSAVLWGMVTFCALLNVVLISVQDTEIHVHLILGALLVSILGAVIFHRGT